MLETTAGAILRLSGHPFEYALRRSFRARLFELMLEFTTWKEVGQVLSVLDLKKWRYDLLLTIINNYIWSVLAIESEIHCIIMWCYGQLCILISLIFLLKSHNILCWQIFSGFWYIQIYIKFNCLCYQILCWCIHHSLAFLLFTDCQIF